MSALTIDTLAVSQVLRKRGFTEDQAAGVVEAFREIDASQLSTKADMREVESRIKEVKTELEVRIDRVKTELDAKIETSSANLKVEILRWLVVTQVALAGFIFAAIKFVK